jgi:hypothetical protein
MERSWLKRVSVALTLICAGMLLLSACGWNPGPRDPSFIPLRYESFVLWQTTPGIPPTIIGEGHVTGSAASIFLNTTLFRSQCAPQRIFSLRGAGSPPLNAEVHTSSVPNRQIQDVAADLTGPFHGAGFNKSIIPLSGSMTLQNWCNGSLALHVEARPGPEHERQWRFSGLSNGVRTSADLSLYQTEPDANGVAWIWGSLFFDSYRKTSGGCNASGNLMAHPVKSPPAEASFGNARGSTATLTNLPVTLDPDPPNELQTTVTIHDGACDGQSFPVTLKSR